VCKDLRNITQTQTVFSGAAGGIFHSHTLRYCNLSLKKERRRKRRRK
jgi:hypothetical protein